MTSDLATMHHNWRAPSIWRSSSTSSTWPMEIHDFHRWINWWFGVRWPWPTGPGKRKMWLELTKGTWWFNMILATKFVEFAPCESWLPGLHWIQGSYINRWIKTRDSKLQLGPLCLGWKMAKNLLNWTPRGHRLRIEPSNNPCERGTQHILTHLQRPSGHPSPLYQPGIPGIQSTRFWEVPIFTSVPRNGDTASPEDRRAVLRTELEPRMCHRWNMALSNSKDQWTRHQWTRIIQANKSTVARLLNSSDLFITCD